MGSAEDAADVPEGLLEVADRLYGLDAGEFTPARDAAAKEAKAAGDAELAARVKKLRKPALSAWAVNLLVRREADQIEQVMALGEQLRAAAESLDGEELRALTRQRRQLTAALTTTTRRLARAEGVKITEAVAGQVEGMLNAALLDPVAAEVVRTGLVVSAFTSTGVSEVDVASVCAVPEAVGGWTALPVEAGAPDEEAGERPALSLVPDDHVKLDKARDRVRDAEEQLEQATTELEEADASLRDLQARRLQLQQEIDELQRRLAALEDDVEVLDEEVDEAEAGREELAAVLEESRTELEEARSALAELEK